MKKIAATICAIFSFALLASCSPAQSSAGSPPSPSYAGMQVELARSDGSSLLVIMPNGDLAALSAKELPEGLHSGAKISLKNDEILETYPAQLNSDGAELISDGDGLLDMYYDCFIELRDEDGALNENINEIALDFTSANLSKGQQEALAYMLAGAYGTGMAYTFASFEDLVSQGKISEGNYFADGLLLTLKADQVRDNKLTFSFSKFRSGTGATGRDSCVLELKDGVWEKNPDSFGSVWIS